MTRYLWVDKIPHTLGEDEMDAWYDATSEDLAEVYVPVLYFGDYEYRETEDDEGPEMTPTRIKIGEFNGEKVTVKEVDAFRVVLSDYDAEIWVANEEFENTFS